MISIITAAGAWIARRFAAWGIGTVATLAFLGPLGPILTGIANAIGALITATFEIVASLAKSAEGRVILAILMAALGFFYLRFHYIEEGKAEARAHLAAFHKPCPASTRERGKR
ncbi:MAG: hypothetical protein ACLPPF_23690 [Rhodomicrobium sp.]